MMNHLITLLCAMSVFFAFTQTEDEVKEKSSVLFDEQKFVEATPYYLRLLSLQPKNATYNYRYGTCLLFNASKKQESLRYLKFAVTDPLVEPLAHFYMGRAFHLNYLFKDAIDSYENFKKIATPSAVSGTDVDRCLEMAKNGRKLLTNYSELVVFDKKEIDAENFFRLYDLSEIGGNLLVAEDFQSKIDEKNGHTPLIYFAPKAETIYYSSYGASEKNGLDIYRRKRFAGGGWADAQIVQGGVNTPYDEDFAYMSHDGKYLYFSSKGHNSMGGYDIFRSAIDERTGIFSDAVNLDFSISSPDDDILFLIDKTNDHGYFASSRESEAGKLNVYKVRVDRIPTKLIILAGTFESRVNPGAQLLIKVLMENGAEVANFSSKSTGQMVIRVPTEGTYSLQMRVAGSEEIHLASVVVPKTTSMRPLQQNFLHVNVNGKETIKIIEKFEESVDNADELIANAFADKAILKPNIDDFDPSMLKGVKARKQVLESIGATDQELADFAASLIRKIETLRKNDELADGFEAKLAFQIDWLLTGAKGHHSKINQEAAIYANMDTEREKLSVIQNTQVHIRKKTKSSTTMERFFVLNEDIQTQQGATPELAFQIWEKLAKELFALADGGKLEDGLEKIRQNKEDFKDMVAANEVDFQEAGVKKLESIDENIARLNKEIFDDKLSLSIIQNELNYLQQSKAKTKKKELETLDNDIANKKREEAMVKDDINNLDNEITSLKNEKDFLTQNLSDFNKYSSVESIKSIKSIKQLSNEYAQFIKQKNDPLVDQLLEDLKNYKEKGGSVIALSETRKEGDKKTELKAYLADVNPRYDEEVFNIQNHPSLSVSEIAQKMVNTENNNLSLLQQELENFNTKFPNADSDPLLRKEKEILQELIERSEGKLNVYEEELQMTNNLSADAMIRLLDPKYESRIKEITNDLEKTDLFRMEALNIEDRTMLVKIKKRKETALAAIDNLDGNIKLLKEELEISQSLDQGFAQKILTRENQIRDLKPTDVSAAEQTQKNTITGDSSLVEFTKPNPITNGSPKLEENEGRTNLKNPVAKELFNELAELEESGTNLERQNELKKEIGQNMNENEFKVIAEQDDLKKADQKAFNDDLKKLSAESELPLEIEEPEEVLADNGIVVNTESKKELIERLVPEYFPTVSKITSSEELTSREKSEQWNNLDNVLIVETKVELKKVGNYARSNPNNRQALEKEMQVNELLTSMRRGLANRGGTETDLANNLPREDIRNEEPIEENEEVVAAIESSVKVETKTVLPELDLSLSSIRNEILKDNENPLLVDPKTPVEITQNLADLARYRTNLANYAENLDEQGSMNAITIYREIALIDERTAKLEGDHKYQMELDQIAVKNQQVLADTNNDRLLVSYEIAESNIVEALNQPNITDKEHKKLEKQLEEAREQRFTRSNSLLKNELERLKLSSLNKYQKLEKLAIVSPTAQNNQELAKTQYRELLGEAADYEFAASEQKDYGLQNDLYFEAIDRLREVDKLLEIIYMDNKVESVSAGALSTLDLYADILVQKNRLEVKVAHIEGKLSDVKLGLMKTESGDGRDNLKTVRRETMAELERTQEIIGLLDKKLNTVPDRFPGTISPLAQKAELSPEEEGELLKSELYKQLSRLTNDAIFYEGEVAMQKKLLAELKRRAKADVQVDLLHSSKKLELDIKTDIIEIIEMEKHIADLQKRLSGKQFEINAIMPQNPEEYHKIQNMILRDVSPSFRDVAIANTNSTEANIVIPSEGITVDMSKRKESSASEPAPAITNALPNGLVFRVQLGAFSEPIKQNIFKEFNPVTGESRPNGLTVYMAGYFPSIDRADEVKGIVRNIGYSDAFVVAYCDGQRITLKEARQLEMTGACIPISIAELQATGVMTTPGDLSNRNSALLYNEVPGAAAATAAEGLEGLFFSVQVGVFSSVVGPTKVKGLTNLVTQRINNGYIRYATGKFPTIDQAKDVKGKVRAQGYSDAFVTAFYQGERITIKAANKLLKERGNDVLYVEPAQGARAVVVGPSRPSYTTPTGTGTQSTKPLRPVIYAASSDENEMDQILKEQMSYGINYTESSGKAKIGMQFVSKKTYNSYPRHAMNRYSEVADFYYDDQEKRIKSKIYTNKFLMPDVYFLRNDVDTLYTLMDNNWKGGQNEMKRTLEFEFEGDRISGELMNYLIRVQANKEYVRKDKEIIVRLDGVRVEKINQIKADLKMMGFTVREMKNHEL
jgi:hypothetical protein